MPRKSMTGNKSSPYTKFRVDSEVQAILDDLKAQGGNISQFIRDSIKGQSSIDTKILRELIPVFIESELKVDLTVEMVVRVKELFEEVSA